MRVEIRLEYMECHDRNYVTTKIKNTPRTYKS